MSKLNYYRSFDREVNEDGQNALKRLKEKYWGQPNLVAVGIDLSEGSCRR